MNSPAIRQNVDSWPRLFAEHLEIVKAIAEHDPDRAEAAARSHIRNAQRARLKLLRARLVSDFTESAAPAEY